MKKTETELVAINNALIELGEEDTGDDLPQITDFPLIAMTIEAILKGTNAKDIKELINKAGYKCGMCRTHSVIRLAKQQILKHHFITDFEERYAWAQSNLMDLHAKAIDSDDDRARAVAIKMLIDLWKLTEARNDTEEKVITPDMIADFEAKLLR